MFCVGCYVGLQALQLYVLTACLVLSDAEVALHRYTDLPPEAVKAAVDPEPETQIKVM